MGDPLVDRYVVRDSDSHITQREVDAVNEWISLGQVSAVRLLIILTN